MITSQPRWLSFTMFTLRLMLYLAAYIVSDQIYNTPLSLWLAGAVIITLLVDFFTNATFWVSARKTMIGLYAAYVAALTVAAYYYTDFAVADIATLFVLTMALSNDAIANSTRWKFMLIALGLSLAYLFLRAIGEETVRSIVYMWAYPLVPVLAILARYLFPHTKHLIHTSLDYRFIRLEILSLGMKRVAAIGIRRNKVDPLP